MPGVTDIVSAVIPCLGEEDAIGAVGASVKASQRSSLSMARQEIEQPSVQRQQAHGLSSNRGVAMGAPFKPASPRCARTPASCSFSTAMAAIRPFRAIRRDALRQLGMRDTTHGWNLEMLMRVAAAGLPVLEIPVGQRRRIGGVHKMAIQDGTQEHPAHSPLYGAGARSVQRFLAGLTASLRRQFAITGDQPSRGSLPEKFNGHRR
jgi:hypothetical protein